MIKLLLAWKDFIICVGGLVVAFIAYSVLTYVNLQNLHRTKQQRLEARRAYRAARRRKRGW